MGVHLALGLLQLLGEGGDVRGGLGQFLLQLLQLAISFCQLLQEEEADRERRRRRRRWTRRRR